MNESQRITMFNAVTEFDRKASTRKGYNPYALGHYASAMERVKRYTDAGHDLRSSVITCFLGRLCDRILRSPELPVMTKDEAKFGLFPKLPYID